MEEKTISVIVPVYNLEKDLPRCLDSILSQTYRELEVIAVDDGSDDGSRSVMEDYARRDGRVRPIFKENGGVTSARLIGIQAATGEWIGFVDGDDEIEARSPQGGLAEPEARCHCPVGGGRLRQGQVHRRDRPGKSRCAAHRRGKMP